MTGEIFRDSNGFGVSYRFVGMIMTVPHGPGLKQNFFFVHTRCSNPFPRFRVYAEFNKRRLQLVATLESRVTVKFMTRVVRVTGNMN